MNEKLGYLEGKKVLVTGADGFIGSHLAEALVEQGCRVTAFIWYNQYYSHGLLDNSKYENKIKFILGDIRDYSSITKAMNGIQIVFHLAALNGIPYSYEVPESYFETNTKGTLNVLQAARNDSIEHILVTSTSETYGSPSIQPIKENSLPLPQSPYAASKVASDALAYSFYCSYGLPISIVRPFNTYGPRQSERAVIPTIINQLFHGIRIQNPVSLNLTLGNIAPTRDFLYISDTVRGFIEIAKCREKFVNTFNLSTGIEISIEQLIYKICDIMNQDVKIIDKNKLKIYTSKERVRTADSELDRLCGDSSKIKSVLGWEPEVTLEQGLKKTVEWFDDNSSVYKNRGYTI